MNFFNPQLQKAFELQQKGDLAGAEVIYKQIINTQAVQDSTIYIHLSQVLSQQAKFDEAIKVIHSAIIAFPGQAQLKITLCQIYLGMNDLNNARLEAEKLVQNFPFMGEVHYLMGTIYIQENNVDAALASFEKAIQYIPGLVEAYFNVGAIHFQKGDKKKAKEYWEKTLGFQPNFVPALMNLAHQLIEETQFKEAIEYLDKVLALDSLHFSAIKFKGMALHAIGEIEQALKLYVSIYDENKPNEEVLILLGNAQRDMDRYQAAEDYYAKALKINPQNTIAKENIEKMGSAMIEGWHFDMLADLKRNEGFDKAIQNTIQGGETVLDIGTGSGLLSMMCMRAGAAKVYSCETIESIAETAKKVVADNGYENEISIFHMRSTSMEVGKELPEKVDVLVSEILDTGLLGEGVLPSVRHAKSNLLKEGGKIIPAGASLKAVFIESENLSVLFPLREISGFDLSSFGKYQRTETYRSEHINDIPHTVLSEEFDLYDVDFYKLPKSTGISKPNVHTTEVEITKNGILHAVAFWFDLHLDSEISLSSGPNGEMVHWGQAIYGFPKGKEVKKGDVIKLRIEQSEMKTSFDIS